MPLVVAVAAVVAVVAVDVCRYVCSGGYAPVVVMSHLLL